MATCGSCKESGQSVEHVKACYSQSRGGTTTVAAPTVAPFVQAYADARDFKPMATVTDVPDSKYAIKDDNGFTFYEVRHGKGRWADFQFVSRLIGHPGDWLRVGVKGSNRMAVLNLIGQDPMGAAKAYSKEFVRCAVCESPLSDPVSMETGFGPICIKRF